MRTAHPPLPSRGGRLDLKSLTRCRAKFTGNEIRISQPDGVDTATKN